MPNSLATSPNLLDSNGNAVEAQTAYDAAMSGPIYVKELPSNASTYGTHASTIVEEAYTPLIFVGVVKNSGTVVSALFVTYMKANQFFYAGTDPSTLG